MKDLIYKNITLRYTDGGGYFGDDVWLGDTSWGEVEIEQESKEHGEGFFGGLSFESLILIMFIMITHLIVLKVFMNT